VAQAASGLTWPRCGHPQAGTKTGINRAHGVRYAAAAPAQPGPRAGLP